MGAFLFQSDDSVHLCIFQLNLRCRPRLYKLLYQSERRNYPMILNGPKGSKPNLRLFFCPRQILQKEAPSEPHRHKHSLRTCGSTSQTRFSTVKTENRTTTKMINSKWGGAVAYLTPAPGLRTIPRLLFQMSLQHSVTKVHDERLAHGTAYIRMLSPRTCAVVGILFLS